LLVVKGRKDRGFWGESAKTALQSQDALQALEFCHSSCKSSKIPEKRIAFVVGGHPFCNASWNF
jgi:hypothetical protein